MDSMVDWDLAATLGARIAGQGPVVSAEEAATVVAELRAAADRSTGLVRDFTGLLAEERTAPVLVVDRAGWVQANADAFSTMLAPVLDKLTEKKGPPTGLGQAVGSRVTGTEVGLLLGFLGSKVLGQFDPFHQTRPAGCCWSRPTSSTSSASCTPTPRTSGSGSASTRRPTGSSSPPSRGCATTCSPRSPRSPTPSTPAGCWRTASSGSPRRCAAAAPAVCSTP